MDRYRLSSHELQSSPPLRFHLMPTSSFVRSISTCGSTIRTTTPSNTQSHTSRGRGRLSQRGRSRREGPSTVGGTSSTQLDWSTLTCFVSLNVDMTLSTFGRATYSRSRCSSLLLDLVAARLAHPRLLSSSLSLCTTLFLFFSLFILPLVSLCPSHRLLPFTLHPIHLNHTNPLRASFGQPRQRLAHVAT